MSAIISPSPEIIRAHREQLRRELRQVREQELRHAGFWRRLRLQVEIERAVSAELRRRFPPQALYASHSPR